ncbi:hypothetical protein Sjap_010526 [Stephania japonica]|uniref:Uncharacterized protein n=1 Tax=Stephania japonica TaxID=461633 RepID=A0AAP0J9R8_9MAGN
MPKLFLSSALIGLFIGVCNFLVSLAFSYLPVSTATILNSTELAFVAIFSFFVVKQLFNAFSVNSAVLMILGCVLLGIQACKDRPAGFQVGLSLFAKVFALIGMLASKEFQAQHKEAKEFGLGSNVYCVVIIGVILVFQLALLGNVGVTFTSSAFFCGILNAALIPIIDIAGVLVYHEHFTAEKGLALAMCLWGLVSYFYGEFKKTKKVDEASSIQISDDSHNV